MSTRIAGGVNRSLGRERGFTHMSSKIIYERFIWFEDQVKTGKYPNTTSLAAKFEISAKTAQRDIEFMRERLDCPLLYDMTRKGYYYEDETFSLPVMHLSSSELSSLIMARKLLRDMSGPVAEDVESAVQKITSVIARHSGSPDSIDKAVSFHIIRYSPVREDVFRAALEACVKKRSLTFSYTSPAHAERTERTVDPYHIFNYMGNWHVMGYCHLRKAIRDFHMGRITGQRIEEDVFTLPKGFDFNKYFDSSFGLYKGSSREEVTIRFLPSHAIWIRGQVWHKDQVERTLEDGSLELTFPVAGFTEISREILRLGSGAEVIRPKELRELIRSEAERIFKAYG
ncbi:MAG TPA: WYL domain-containing protein [Thermodesulfovibrionales bacterium]|nr:WYL domain-containing protein [Thermodesulfovibrionales bacterium]